LGQIHIQFIELVDKRLKIKKLKQTMMQYALYNNTIQEMKCNAMR